MTQEEKSLLLKDLGARLPYGVKCTTKSSWNGIYTIEGYKDNRVFLDCPVYDEGDDEWMIESIVPYLRPMSSMTEEEEKEYLEIIGFKGEDENGWIRCDNIHTEWGLNLRGCNKLVSWLDKNHFDHRTDEKGKTLIEKGLALEAPKRMYK